MPGTFWIGIGMGLLALLSVGANARPQPLFPASEEHRRLVGTLTSQVLVEIADAAATLQPLTGPESQAAFFGGRWFYSFTGKPRATTVTGPLALHPIAPDALKGPWDESGQEHWIRLAAFFQPVPSCSPGAPDPLPRLWQLYRDTASADAVVTTLSALTREQRGCLFLKHLLGDEGQKAVDLLTVVHARSAADPVLGAYLAVGHLHQRIYPEALRQLAELQLRWTPARLLYDGVQRIYALRQRGAGKVAIRGL